MKKHVTVLISSFLFTIVGIAQNVGIGITTPRFPLSFSTAVGQKISLWDDGNVQGNQYGIGVQPGLLQIHANTSTDNIGFGTGSSANFTERFRITGSGNLGLNTTLPSSYGHAGASTILELQNPLASAFNPNTQLVLSTKASSGHVGGVTWASTALTGEKRLTYIGSQLGASGTGSLLFFTRTSLGVLTQRMSLNGAGTLRLDGPTASASGENVLSVGGNGSLQVDANGIVGGRLTMTEAGLVGLNNNAPNSRLDVNGDINMTGPLKMNGNPGAAGQLMVSNGNGLPAWTTAGNVVKSQWAGEAVSGFLHLAGYHEMPDAALNISLATNSRIYLYYKTGSFTSCGIGACFSKWELSVYVDGSLLIAYGIDGVGIAGESTATATTYRHLGPDIIDLPAGNHAITFKARNISAAPLAYLTSVAVVVAQ